MKLGPAQIGGFLRDPGACRVVLLYGDDVGMIRERAEAMVRAVAGSLDDPFRVVELDRDSLGGLVDEAASLSLTGGRRVVRARDVPESVLAHVQAILKGPGTALVILEAPGIAARTRLCTLLEELPEGTAIGCYPEEGRALEGSVRDILRAAGVGIDADALSWLTGHLGADRASTRSELEKLALYAGPAGRVDLDAAMACIGDLAGLSLDDAIFAAMTGDVATADRALEMAMGEGAAPVQVIRTAQGHLQRMHRVRTMMETDRVSAADAAKAARPPIFYRRISAFVQSLGLWSADTLLAAMAAMAEAERGCKRTGWPDETLCRNAILTLARRAAVARRAAARRG